MYEKISDSVYFIHGEEYDSNSILVVSDIVFLVDTGTGNNNTDLQKTLTEMGHQPEAILNTHCHFDHVGGNKFFDLPVYIHKNDLPHLANPDEYLASSFFGKTLPASNPLPLPHNFHNWQIIHTPGHTQGSVCLFKDNILISGDTIFADGYGRTDLLGGNEEQLQQSLDKLSKIRYEFLLPGHGPKTQSDYKPYSP